MARDQNSTSDFNNWKSPELRNLEKVLNRTNYQLSAIDRMGLPQNVTKASASSTKSESVYDQAWVKNIATTNEIAGNFINILGSGDTIEKLRPVVDQGRARLLSRGVLTARQTKVLNHMDKFRTILNHPISNKMVNINQKAGKYLGPLGIASDLVKIATSKPGDEQNKAIGEAVGSKALSFALGALFTAIPIPGATLAGSAIGHFGGKYIGGFLGENYNNISGWSRKRYNQATNWTSDTINQGMDRIRVKGTEAYQQASAWTKDKYIDVSKTVNETWDNVREKYSNFSGKVSERYSEMSGKFTSGIQEASEVISKKFDEVTDKVEGGFNNTVNNIKSFIWGGGKEEEPKETISKPSPSPSFNYSYQAPSRELINKIINNPEDKSAFLPSANSNPRWGYSLLTSTSSSPSPAPVNVSLPPGAIQLSLSGNELNYEELSVVLGEKLTAAIQQSLNNRNVAFNAGR